MAGCRKHSFRALALVVPLVCLILGRTAATPTFKEDLITSLPGAPNAAFNQYSGYITVDEDHGKALFYWFVESMFDPEQKPLTLWLNGGPGCSSIGVGALAELGPFFTSKTGHSLIPNLNAWNRISNILFVESPIGTGFSYSNTSSDYQMGDKQTAIDARIFVQRWLERFPHYQGRHFYITGESYGGHYIPHLAKELWDNMNTTQPHIPFKGFAIGNPWTDPAVDYRAEVDFWYSRALISTETYVNLTTNCGVKDYWEDVPGSMCLELLTKAYAEMGDINIYNTYVDICRSSTFVANVKAMYNMKHNNLRRRLAEAGASVKLPWEYDPCIHYEVEEYLNKAEVQKAMHANTTDLPYRWTECSTVLNFSEADSISSVLPIYEELLKTPLQIVIFSGDVDSAIPTLGTRRWMEKLERGGHLAKSQPWRAWYHEQQVAGYTEEYNDGRFKLVTIHGAGHMVPYMQPARGFEMFKSFLHNTELPDTARFASPDRLLQLGRRGSLGIKKHQ